MGCADSYAFMLLSSYDDGWRITAAFRANLAKSTVYIHVCCLIASAISSPSVHPSSTRTFRNIPQDYPLNKSVYCLDAYTFSHAKLYPVVLCRSYGVILELILSFRQYLPARHAYTWVVWAPRLFLVLHPVQYATKMMLLHCACSSQ